MFSDISEQLEHLKVFKADVEKLQELGSMKADKETVNSLSKVAKYQSDQFKSM